MEKSVYNRPSSPKTLPHFRNSFCNFQKVILRKTRPLQRVNSKLDRGQRIIQHITHIHSMATLLGTPKTNVSEISDLEFTEKKNTQWAAVPLCENALFMLEVRGERADCFELIGRQTDSKNHLFQTCISYSIMTVSSRIICHVTKCVSFQTYFYDNEFIVFKRPLNQ